MLAFFCSQVPDFVRNLPAEVWAKWAPIITAYPGNEAPPADLVAPAYRHAREIVIQTILKVIEHENEKHGYIFCVSKIPDCCWDTNFLSALSSKLRDEKLKPTSLGRLLVELLERGSEDAYAFVVSLLSLPIPKDETPRARAQQAAVALLTKAKDGGWNYVWPALRSDDEFGQGVIYQLASTLRFGLSKGLAEEGSEDNLADFYIWTVKQFPPQEDPVLNGPHTVEAREMVARFRDGMLATLKGLGTPVACAAIERIMRELPHLTNLKWVLLDARENMLRRTWLPPSPEHFLELTRRKGSRLVRSADQLLELLVESLQRLQTKLQGETPQVEFLWDRIDQNRWRPKDESSLANYIKGFLKDDLEQAGVVALREVEIRRSVGKGTGQTTDIHVTGLVPSSVEGKFNPVRVIIEVKGCWHPEVTTAMKTQLVERYLRDNPCRHGLYVVGWFCCSLWDDADPKKKQSPKWSVEEARMEFDRQAKELSANGLVIRSVVLDVALGHV